MSDKKPSDAAFRNLQLDDSRVYAIARQSRNGYRDVDGLWKELQKRGEPKLSHAAAGRINKYLKYFYRKTWEEECIQRVMKYQANRALLDVLKGDSSNLALDGNLRMQEMLILDDDAQEQQRQLHLQKLEEMQDLPPDKYIRAQKNLAEMHYRLQRSQGQIESKRQADLDALKAQIDELEQYERAASEGDTSGKRTIDAETLRIIRQEIYGLE